MKLLLAYNWRANTRKGLTDSFCESEVCAGKSRVTDYIFNLLPKRTRRTQLTNCWSLLSMNYTPDRNAIHIVIVIDNNNNKFCRLLMWNRPFIFENNARNLPKKCWPLTYIYVHLTNKMNSCCVMNVLCCWHNVRVYAYNMNNYCFLSFFFDVNDAMLASWPPAATIQLTHRCDEYWISYCYMLIIALQIVKLWYILFNLR